MFTAELRFKLPPRDDYDEHINTIDYFIGALHGNGQILGDESPMAQSGDVLRVFVMLPEEGALSDEHHNVYVRKWIADLNELGVEGPAITVLGEDPTRSEACACENSPSYILFTNFNSVAPPLWCGECLSYVPLYRLPPTYHDEEYYNIHCWQSDYQACDTLQMGCRTGERWGTRELSGLGSTLSLRGREIAAQIEQLTGVPTYYYLYRYLATTMKREIARKCPGCGGEWLLEERYWIRDFQCDGCRLISNISFSVDDMHQKLARLDKHEAACQNEAGGPP